MSNIFIPSATSSFSTRQAFLDFQEQAKEMGDTPDVNRFYLQYLAMTNKINQNHVQMTDEALEMLAEGYRTGLPLTINHMKGLGDDAVGIGQTISADVQQGALYVNMYIARNKTYNMSMIGSSNELIDAILDGYIKRGSTSINIREAECSVCGSEIEHYWGCEEHPKGRKMVVTNDSGVDEIVEPYIIVKAAEAVEFSITMLGADDEAQVTEKNLNLYLDDLISTADFNRILTPQSQSQPQRQLQPGSGPTQADAAPQPQPQPTNGGKTTVTPEEKQALEAQLASEKARADANQVTIDSQKVMIEAKDNELKTLREQAVANNVLIADGKTARKEFEDAYIKEFTAYTDATPEAEDAQRKLIADFTLDVIKQKTETMQKENAKKFPNDNPLSGDGGSGDGGPGDGGEEDFSGV